MSAYSVISQRLKPGSSATLEYDPLFNTINQLYSELYRLEDLHMPPMHVGAFMFRDVFFPLRIPLIYGSPAINPVDFLTDVPDIPKQWLFNNRQTGLAFFDQVIDLMDFVYGLNDLEKKTGQIPEVTMEYWYLAKQQIEAAAATLLNSFNKYAVIQNCCIATELLLKGTLIARGMDKETLRKSYGHNLENLANKTVELVSNINREMLLHTVKQLPDYVKSRYEANKFSRLELGRFLMNTQFISGEILRQFSAHNYREDFTKTLDEDWNLTDRTFPKKQNDIS